MSAHTPGPWFDVSDKRKPKRAASEYASALVATPTGTLAIDCTKSGKTHAEDLANARLIAAAPELLEALRGLLNHYVALVNSGDAGHWDAEFEQQVIASRTAIAKATGEA